MKNNIFKEAMAAALPSPQAVPAAAPQQPAEGTVSGNQGSSLTLGIEAMTSKKQDHNKEEMADRERKLHALRPLA